jgi:hypothetical protein
MAIIAVISDDGLIGMLIFAQGENIMPSKTLDELMVQANSLTLDEQLRLAAYLLERVRTGHSPRRKWREIRGLAHPSLLGEDAQSWVSRTRDEADEHRERQWSRQS